MQLLSGAPGRLRAVLVQRLYQSLGRASMSLMKAAGELVVAKIYAIDHMLEVHSNQRDTTLDNHVI